MLITLQFPLCDLRPFVAPQTRLPRPHWPVPDPHSEFVRFFGKVRERRKREVPWFDEGTYCLASQALKIVDPALKQLGLRFAFRRLFSDGRAVARIEVGINCSPTNKLTGGSLLSALTNVLDLKCTTRRVAESRTLITMGKDLAKLYQEGSSPKSETLADFSVMAGRPCVVIEYSNWEIDELPISLDVQKSECGFAFSKITHRGADLNTWYVSSAAKDSRMRRLCLLRLHAEHQALKQVLWAISDGRINLEPDSPSSDAVQTFLLDTVKTMTKGERYGVAQKDLLDVVQSYTELSAKNEIPLLEQQMQGIRRQVKKRVLDQVEKSVRHSSEERVGPSFEWRGPVDELEYHSFFNGSPLIPAGWIGNVVKKLCPAVCLIRNPSKDYSATGFLVGPDLLLTNYHVVAGLEEDESPLENAAGMELTFELSTEPKRVFKLAADPLLAFSQNNDHDFALLRTAENIAKTLSVNVITYDGSAVPEKRKGIHILQHPKGGILKISGDADGITGVYQDSGLVQYVSQAEPGSSGGPCFNDELKLVALHHAEVKRPFGSIREGILFKVIFEKIKNFISPPPE